MSNNEPEKKSFGWYFWWKIDRTLAILSLVVIVWLALSGELKVEGAKIAGQAIGALAVYIGARSAK